MTAQEELSKGAPAEPGTGVAAEPGEGAAMEPGEEGREEAGVVPAGERRSRRRRGRRGRRVAVAAAVVVAGGIAAAAVVAAGGGGSPGGTAAGALPPATAKVTRQTLADTRDADGQLGYGPARTAGSRARGTLTWLPDSGDRVTRGRSLFEVDGDPVTLMYGSMPAYRTLQSGMEGRDVRQLETNLRRLGYDGFTVDDEYTADTADAVAEWQDDRGLPETGTVPLGQVVFADGAVRIEALEAAVGDPVQPGGRVLSYTGTDKAVTVELEAADRRLAEKGAKVEITLPDERTVAGRVTEVSTVIEPGEGEGDESQTMIEVIVELTGEEAQQAADEYALAAVDVTFTAETKENVLTVPVAALLALREGGFGLEVVRGGTTTLVPVRTGLFADGRVEVSGNGIAEGTVVGMPK
ncbi:efflux RND transporter periplasmic adaptor subunit [Thermomonospora cellulosilytica]|uniref:Peptidoglycan hydrolase-like protein with peptidoglycan-binding domain n=1 Tax=Thermomonospora cellulosilytica TaxID=1411118 RepID=A0A7W3R862_9ACTN|nr:peptidoglycan-binding protein [Thermomonospora cellulosilytica]MBA9003973.1 peptidoglycan hydrolase-like protein with peptidoglycan-binding domain [Thermomonospora cellulosilytica]